MPASVSFAAELGGEGGPDPLIREALADRPATGPEAGLSGIGCDVEPIEDGLRITATLRLPPTGGPETVVFEPRAGAVWVSEAQVTRAGGTLIATADLVPDIGATASPEPQPYDRDRAGPGPRGRNHRMPRPLIISAAGAPPAAA